MIFVTGDLHSNPNRLSHRRWPAGKHLTRDDYVIVAGDFGLIWNPIYESKMEKYNLDWLSCLPFTVLFIDGNHENFDRLNKFPLESWNGGMVHKIRENVLHLCRGHVFNINGKKIFTFGGARSHDITDGILDPVKDAAKIKMWNKDSSKLFRVKGMSWWEDEMPTTAEMDFGWYTLGQNRWEVDYIITHAQPSDLLFSFRHEGYNPDELTDFLNRIRNKVSYKIWISGHLHINRRLSLKDIILYEDIIQLE